MKRRVLALTAIRSEYFFQRPMFRAIMDHQDLALEVVVAGAHLSPLHGYTGTLVEADGFPVVGRIESLLYSDRDAARLKGAATELQVLAHLVDERRPDWLLASGDREEAMLLALCGAYMNIPVAHYAAGDRVVGNVDDMVRHAISRIAHLMLTTNEPARERLIRAGEQDWRVHTVGHTGVDRIRLAAPLDRTALAKALGVPAIAERYVVVVQHPISSEIGSAGRHMRETLEAAQSLGLQTFVSYPNSDAGSQDLIAAIEAFRARPGVHVFRNIPDDPFVALLKGAAMLLGNSSLGVLEAPYLHLAAINVGARQSGRLHADNLFFVTPERAAIAKQMQAVLGDAAVQANVRGCTNPYGDGQAGGRIAGLLAGTPIDARLLNKDLTY